LEHRTLARRHAAGLRHGCAAPSLARDPSARPEGGGARNADDSVALMAHGREAHGGVAHFRAHGRVIRTSMIACVSSEKQANSPRLTIPVPTAAAICRKAFDR